jgi:glycosyltransferase involved in cell wall biosynthesis
MKSILFYCDAAEFGGHEAMTLKIVRHLCRQRDLRVTFAYYEKNERLRENLQAVSDDSRNLRLWPLESCSKSLQALRTLVSFRKIEKTKAFIRDLNPDVVVISQGRIEAGSLGLLSAKKAGYRTITYLPVAHEVSVAGKSFAVKLRSTINTYYYRLPDRIITISEKMRAMLRERGAAGDIVIVANAIELQEIKEYDRHRFREAHGLKDDEYAIAIVGRIHFRQKGQDFAVRTIAQFREQLQGCKFLFVGQGPDENRLKDAVKLLGLSQLVEVVPWMRNPGDVYAGMDMLLIPSRFEGVPLVMLEAMSHRIPIAASDSDGMAEILPQEWRFPFGNAKAMIDTIQKIRCTDQSRTLELHRRRILDEFTLPRFCSEMTQAILQQVEVSDESCDRAASTLAAQK